MWVSLVVVGLVGVSVWTARSRSSSASSSPTTLDGADNIPLRNSLDESEDRAKPPCPPRQGNGINQGELPNSDEECDEQATYSDEKDEKSTTDKNDEEHHKPPCPPRQGGDGVNQGELPNSDEECDEQLEPNGGN